jgi:hypothetical protein
MAIQPLGEINMKSIIKFLIAALFAGSLSLANADVVEVWQCHIKDGKTVDDLNAASSAWLTAMKSMEGGAEVEAYHNFSIVAYNGENGFNFISITPDVAAWGKLAAAYPGSAVQKADVAWSEVADCKGNSLWSSEKVK